MSCRIILLAASLTAVLAVGCGPGEARRSESPTAAANQTDAEAFGRIVIPPGAQVLATTVDRGIDMRYQMTVHMQPDQVRQLLQESHFTEPLNPSDYGTQIAANAGPPMSTATSLRYAQDRIDTPEHGAVTREIFEDVRAEGVYVHIFAFTT